MSPGSLDFLFNPKSIAVVGASNNIESHGHNHFNFQLSYGFKGPVYPINPKGGEIIGRKAYPSLLDVPGTIDHVIIAVSVAAVPDILTQASQKGVKSMHIYAGRASETGRPEAIKIDQEILRRAREFNIRIVGPNALGIFCPRTGIAFGYDFPPEPGTVGAIMQSGANSTDLCHGALWRGVKFSKAISYGNALDINEIDLWEYFADDPETKVLLCYNEGLKGDPKKFLELVRRAASQKPVIICKGGRTESATRFTIGHTHADANRAREVWGEPIRQAGAIMVKDIDELLDLAVAFSQMSPIKGNRVGTGGGGGGNCTLNSDKWEENGFTLPPLPQAIHEEFKKRGSILWDWIKNPGDFSIVAPNDAFTVPALLEEMSKYPDFDFVAGYVGEDFPFKVETLRPTMINDNVEGYIKVFKQGRKPFLAILRSRPLGLREMESERHKIYATIRTRFLEEGVPFFESVEAAAKAVKGVISYYQRKG